MSDILIKFRFADEFGFTPAQVNEMTLDEIDAFLTILTERDKNQSKDSIPQTQNNKRRLKQYI